MVPGRATRLRVGRCIRCAAPRGGDSRACRPVCRVEALPGLRYTWEFLRLLGGRSTVGQQTLTLLIGVRIPASQPLSFPSQRDRQVSRQGRLQGLSRGSDSRPASGQGAPWAGRRRRWIPVTSPRSCAHTSTPARARVASIPRHRCDPRSSRLRSPGRNIRGMTLCGLKLGVSRPEQPRRQYLAQTGCIPYDLDTA